MRFAQNQHKIGYGDESWATDSMMRNQSMQQQYHPGNLSFRNHEKPWYGLVRVSRGTGRIILETDKEKDEQNDFGILYGPYGKDLIGTILYPICFPNRYFVLGLVQVQTNKCTRMSVSVY